MKRAAAETGRPLTDFADRRIFCKKGVKKGYTARRKNVILLYKIVWDETDKEEWEEWRAWNY